jgi:nucleoside-diphosphate-sugar epimerase
MKVIIFGSTGMIGKGILLECLEDPNIKTVLVINRQACGIKHSKLIEIVHENFFDFSDIKDQFKGFDACFFCLGVSSAGLDEAKYSKITYDLTTGVAKILVELNPGSVFCYISGAGTDSSEKGRIMWARIKGKTENALLALPFKESYMFRPGYIQPLKGIRSKTRFYNIFYMILKPFYHVLKLFPGLVTDTVSFSRAMINAAMNGYDKRIIRSKDIYILSHSK